MHDSLKICLSSMHFFPAFGGGQLRFQRYLPGFRARGVETDVFTATTTLERAAASEIEVTWMDSKIGQVLPVDSVEGVSVHRVRLPENGNFRRNWIYGRAIVNYCREQGDDLDLVQVLNPTLWAAPWLRTLRRLRIPTVFTLTLARPLSKSPWKRAIQRRLWSYPMRLVDCVVVSSAVVRDSVRELGIEDRIEIIPNGVDIERFRAPKEEFERQAIRQALNIPHDAPIVLYVGIIHPRKGIDFLLETWKHLAHRLPKAHLVLAGPRDDLHHEEFSGYRDKLNHLVGASGAADRIHFVGRVSNVEDYFRAADVFVFASSLEGMGNVLLEAMASEVPVVTTPFVGLPAELGAPGQDYLLAERKPEAMAHAVEQALHDKLAQNVLGQRGRLWVINELSVEKSLDRYTDLYRDLVKQRSSKRRNGKVRKPVETASVKARLS
jgi:glycosyltransferase involved in cell wall biosynthesis